MKTAIVLQLMFGIGFFLYLYANAHWAIQVQPKEWQIFWRRTSLILVLLPLLAFAVVSGNPFIRYFRKPKWNEPIYFPFIWSGFHRTPVKGFLLIALAANIAVFTPFLVVRDEFFVGALWLLALLFSATNALLEELVWRGALLSRFSDLLGDKWAVLLTSLGFGLQHYSLGFPWLACLAFSVGGLFFGGITIKSGSIYPAMVWHFALNMLMVLSGFILD